MCFGVSLSLETPGAQGCRRDIPMRVLPLVAPLVVAGLLGAAETADTVRFNRDIRPIMSDTCFHCHGFDPKSRKGGLRLDIREDALKAVDTVSLCFSCCLSLFYLYHLRGVCIYL